MTAREYQNVEVPVCIVGASHSIGNRGYTKLCDIKIVQSINRTVYLYRTLEDEPMVCFGVTSSKQFIERYGSYFARAGAGVLVSKAHIKSILLTGDKVVFPDRLSRLAIDLGDGDLVGIGNSKRGVEYVRMIVEHHLLG